MKKMLIAALLLGTVLCSACSVPTGQESGGTLSDNISDENTSAGSITDSAYLVNPEETNDTANNPVEDTDSGSTVSRTANFAFSYRGVSLIPGELADIEALLGVPDDKMEAPSCIHDGNDVLYYYDGVEIATSPVNGGHEIVSITIVSDAACTEEGITIGDPVASITAAYGAQEPQFGRLLYTSEKTVLTILLDAEGRVSSIAYTAVS